jgi:hypothetical protein
MSVFELMSTTEEVMLDRKLLAMIEFEEYDLEEMIEKIESDFPEENVTFDYE